MATKKELTQEMDVASAVSQSLKNFNNDYGFGWTTGTNWTNEKTEFETYVNKYLFPKLTASMLVSQPLGNRFNDLAKETPYIGQFSEEYVIMDTVPVAMNMSKNTELMFKRNYPRMATKLYGNGTHKKIKFTLNDTDARQNWSTIMDGINFAIGVYNKAISDINYSEDLEVKGMLLDYALNILCSEENKNKKHQVLPASDIDSLINRVNETFFHLQDNSSNYNEARMASGGAVGRYTTTTDLSNVRILTSDIVKARLLDTRLANTFQVKGLDFSSIIYSYADLGGVFKTTKDVKLDQEAVNYMGAFGDYQAEAGDLILEGSVFTYDISDLKCFKDSVTEIKPETDVFAFVFDKKALRYHRDTSRMQPKEFVNPEFLETNHWIHYESLKAVSPFYNKIVIKGE